MCKAVCTICVSSNCFNVISVFWLGTPKKFALYANAERAHLAVGLFLVAASAAPFAKLLVNMCFAHVHGPPRKRDPLRLGTSLCTRHTSPIVDTILRGSRLRSTGGCKHPQPLTHAWACSPSRSQCRTPSAPPSTAIGALNECAERASTAGGDNINLEVIFILV